MTVSTFAWVTCVTLLVAGAVWRVQCNSIQDLATKNGEFGLELYQEIAKQTDGNIIISPFSMSAALAMTLLGAKGVTKDEMSEILKFTEVESQLHESFKELLSVLNSDDNEYTLEIANKLFGRKDFSFVDDFIIEAKNFYEADLQKMDFLGDAEGSRQTINNWVQSQTQDKIKDFLPTDFIEPSTVLVLVNAIYFKGLWKVPFNSTDTVTQKFNEDADTSADVQMMKLFNKRFSYGDDGKTKVLSMPYEGDEISFNILLPNDIEGLAELESNITMEKLNEMINQASNSKIQEVAIPSFKLEQKIDMVGMLQAMGIEDLFTTRADLSGISAGGNLVVSDVIHEAVIEVNEEGTEAAASTSAGMVLTSLLNPSLKFIADHPFMFCIREENTGSILFLGRYNGPPSGENIIGLSLKQDGNPSKAGHTVSSFTTLLVFFILAGLTRL